MGYMKFLIIVLALFSSLIPLSSCKLKLVIDVIRHGARSGLFVSEYFKQITWPLLGELTPSGERQQCLLGMLRRKEYIENKKLLSEVYDPVSMYVRSTSSNRTIMSAQAYLTCLYPNGLEILNEQQMKHVLDWLKPPILFDVDKSLIDNLGHNATPHSVPSIPIQTVDVKTEGLLLSNDCPYVNQEMYKYFESAEFKDLTINSTVWVRFRDLYKHIPIDYYLKEGKGFMLADLFICAAMENQLPDNITKEFIQGFKEYVGLVQANSIKGEMMNKLMMHDFVEEVLQHMKNAENGTNKIKYVLYSGHDITLTMILIGLNTIKSGINVTQQIPFASNLLFEVDEDKGNTIVRALLNGKEIYKEEYGIFVEKFKSIGNIGKSKKDACKIPGNPNSA